MDCCRRPSSDETEQLVLYEEHSLDVSKNETEKLRTKTHKQDDTKNKFLGYGSVLLGTLAMCFGLSFSQLLDRSVPHSELNGLRFSTQLAMCVIAISMMKNKYEVLVIERKYIGWAFLASLFNVATCYGSYGASYYLPVGSASGIARSCELLLAYVVGIVITRSFCARQLIAMVICITGMIIIVQPTFIFHRVRPSLLKNESWAPSHCNSERGLFAENLNISSTNASTSTKNNQQSLNWDHVAGYTFTCLESVMDVATMLVISHKLKDLRITAYIFWSSILGVVFSFCLMAVTESPTIPHLPTCICFLMAHMLLSGSQNVFYILGYQRVSPTMCALIATAQIPLTFILQYTLLSGMYPGHANALEISGALVMFVGNALVPVLEAINYFKSERNTDA